MLAQGFTQVEGIDFINKFAPVVDRNMIRVFCTFACYANLVVQQIDVRTAFLHASLEEVIYVHPPSPYDNTAKVWRLHKALYGLKQSPSLRNIAFNKLLEEYGFKRSVVEECLYTNESMMAVVYVDDILIAGKTKEDINKLTNYLKKEIAIKELGEPKLFLGIEIEHKENIYLLNQRVEIEKLAGVFLGGVEVRASSKPLPSGVPPEDEELCDKPVRSLVGGLLYVSEWTRPDISTSVNLLSRFVHKPTREL